LPNGNKFTMARLLGIDWGSKRIGIALSDEMGIMAFTPLSAIINDNKVLKKIGTIIKKEKVKQVVLGMPISLNGGRGKSAESVLKFGDLLKKSYGIQINYLDERFTTGLATRKLRETGAKNKLKGEIDNAVAQILLQQYLDKNKKTNEQKD